MRRTALLLALVAAGLTGCGGAGEVDGEELLGSLEGDVACTERIRGPKEGDEHPTWGCLTSQGSVVISPLGDSDVALRVATFLDSPYFADGQVVVLDDDEAWTAVAPHRRAGAQIADQLGGVIADQQYFDEELLGSS